MSVFFVLLQLAGFAYAIAMNTFVFEKVSDELNRRLADAMVRIEYFDLEKKESWTQFIGHGSVSRMSGFLAVLCRQ